MRVPAAVALALGIAVNSLAAQSPADSVESIYIARSWRTSRVPPTEFCSPAHAGFPGAAVEDQYSFRSIAVAPDGRATDADVQEVGRLHACFAQLPAGKFNFFAQGVLGTVPFTGRGECETLGTDLPEPGLLSQRCYLRLEHLPPGYLGGLLTTNTINSRNLIGGASDPPGYTQPSIATIRLWRPRTPGTSCGLGWVCPRPRSDSAQMAEAAAFDQSSRAIGIGPLRTTELAPDQWEIRWWSRGFVNAETGISSMLRVTGTADSIRATNYVLWQKDLERFYDSLSWRDERGRKRRQSMIAWYKCARVERRPPVEVCHSPITAEQARAFRNAFQRFGGWDLPDQSQGEPRHLTLDGGGWLIEVVRNGRYRNYGFDNPEDVGYGLWERATILTTALACAAGLRTEKCPSN
jgi:hypothetical protein